MESPGLSLHDGLLAAGIGYSELWSRYLALGGTETFDELRGHVETDIDRDDNQHNVIAQALNDVFVDRGQNHPVAYRNLYRLDERAD
ncbi:MAG: hypothetical protein JO147_14140 [Actinobacteria bacterium]|nr:hypothetical protein [Actinomycetota bacterium]